MRPGPRTSNLHTHLGSKPPRNTPSARACEARRPEREQNVRCKSQEREELSRSLDRCTTIRPGPGRDWMPATSSVKRQTSPLPRVKSQMYSEQEKTKPFRPLPHGQHPDAREGARFRQGHLLQVGQSTRDLHGQRYPALNERSSSISARAALVVLKQPGKSVSIGAPPRTGHQATQRWTRVPHGRVLRYRQAAILANVKNPRYADGRGGRLLRNTVQRLSMPASSTSSSACRSTICTAVANR